MYQLLIGYVVIRRFTWIFGCFSGPGSMTSNETKMLNLRNLFRSFPLMYHAIKSCQIGLITCIACFFYQGAIKLQKVERNRKNHKRTNWNERIRRKGNSTKIRTLIILVEVKMVAEIICKSNCLPCGKRAK